MQHAAENTERRFQIPGHAGFPLIGSILGDSINWGADISVLFEAGKCLLEEHSVVTDRAFISKRYYGF